MTKVTITNGRELLAISMVGHANHEGSGGDIVCAACSVLIQSLVNALYTMDARIHWTQKSGEAHLRLMAGKTLHRDIAARGAFQMACVGLQMLAQSYPKNVQISEN